MPASILTPAAQASLLSALRFVSLILERRLHGHASSDKLDDVCEVLTAAVYLISSAASPQFTSRSSRLRSFELAEIDRAGWSRQRVEDMVESGFYHVGDGAVDHVKCFFCDLGLKDWEPADTPVSEHAKFSPLCFFIKSSRGLDWVKSQCVRVPNFPTSYTRQDHNKLLETLCQEFASPKSVIAASVGNNRTTVLLQISRSFIRRREKLTLEGLVMELQSEMNREMGVATDSETPWFPSEFDLATVAEEFQTRLQSR